ncbi:MAG TPA: NAD-dependent epimerase/dehydratase family protein [Thermoanaerobaculia bacterium]|nr:NAD-dependent epimerase/dehydratase family protein [Thermoanaerobaculia bacterium]
MIGRVLITGASGALGSSVVRRFAAAGQPVLAVQRGDSVEGVTRPTAAAAPEAVAIRSVDLTSTGGVARLFAETARAG